MAEHNLNINTDDPINYIDVETDPVQASTENAGGTSGIPVENQPTPESQMSLPTATDAERAMIGQQIAAQVPSAQVGALPSDVLFPGATPVRQIGTVSNKYGSAAIYGGGAGPYPVGAMLARKKALADQAAAEAKARAEQKWQIATPEYKIAKPFGKGVAKEGNKLHSKFWNKAVQDYGKDARAALASSETSIGREYQMAMKGLNTLVESGDRVAGIIEGMEEKMSEGKVYSNKAYELRDMYYSLSSDLTDEEGSPDPYKLANLETLMKEVIAYDALETVAKNINIDAIQGTIIESGGYEDLGDLMESRSSRTKKYDDAISSIAEGLVRENGLLAGQVRAGVVTKQQVIDYLDARLGEETKYVTTAKYAPESRGGRLGAGDVSGINEQSQTNAKFKSYDSDGNETGDFEVSMSDGDVIPTTTKKINMTGVTVLAGDRGETETITGNDKVQFVKTGSVPAATLHPNKFQGAVVDIPVIISNIEKEIQREVLNDYGQGTGEYKTQKVLIQAPIVVDENVISTILANPSASGLTNQVHIKDE
jgi:hypothetical protein